MVEKLDVDNMNLGLNYLVKYNSEFDITTIVNLIPGEKYSYNMRGNHEEEVVSNYHLFGPGPDFDIYALNITYQFVKQSYDTLQENNIDDSEFLHALGDNMRARINSEMVSNEEVNGFSELQVSDSAIITNLDQYHILVWDSERGITSIINSLDNVYGYIYHIAGNCSEKLKELWESCEGVALIFAGLVIDMAEPTMKVILNKDMPQQEYNFLIYSMGIRMRERLFN